MTLFRQSSNLEDFRTHLCRMRDGLMYRGRRGKEEVDYQTPVQ
jgi:hypothetical protein